MVVKKAWLAFVLLVAVSTVATAQETHLRLPSIFASHMVLQQGQPVPVWGWTKPGGKVTVEFAGQKISCTADRNGAWRVTLKALKADVDPQEMKIIGDGEIVLTDVLVGEVWVGSGQSNMQWALSHSDGGPQEIAAANKPGIRLFLVPNVLSAVPNSNVNATWVQCSPQTVGNFSAVLYHFGRELNEQLEVPVGLIASAWGGSKIEPWTPPAGFAGVPEVADILEHIRDTHESYLESVEAAAEQVDTSQRDALKAWLKDAKAAVRKNAQLPSLAPGVGVANPMAGWAEPCSMYNAMIHPVVPFAVKGAIWYQGESNVTEGMLYRDKTQALVEGWRTVWGQKSLSFYWAQLAPFNYGGAPHILPRLWEAQTAAMSIPDTGMAVITDIGTPHDIHPRNKRDVGKRLSLWALAKDYGRDVVYSGPLFRKAAVEENAVRVMFDHTGGGLMSRDGKDLTLFEILTLSNAVPAKARIVPAAESGLKEDTVLVWSDNVKNPIGARFAWNKFAQPNLVNKEGLPANCFRTVCAEPVFAGKRLFLKETVVTITCPERNGRIRYTLDGSMPNEHSRKYARPIRLKKSAEVKARFFCKDGRNSLASSASFEKVEPMVHDGKVLGPGVKYEYYEVQADGKLPDFATLQTVTSGLVDEIQLAGTERPDSFAVRFSGYLRISQAGSYLFQVTSDDGSRLLLDGQVVVDNDGQHPMIMKEGSVELGQGMHAIEVLFFEAVGGEGLEVLYRGPDSSALGAVPVWCEQ